jgi:hypothetical protein
MLMIQYMFLALKGTKKVANKDSFRHFFTEISVKNVFGGGKGERRGESGLKRR